MTEDPVLQPFWEMLASKYPVALPGVMDLVAGPVEHGSLHTRARAELLRQALADGSMA